MGGEHRPATPRDRALGAELRAIRERNGMSLAEVSASLQWNASTLSRLERGLRHISPEAVMGLAVIYQLPAPQRNDLIARAKEPTALAWWDPMRPGVSSELGALASYEREAIRMTNWSPGIIPGLLQVPAYAAIVMRNTGTSEQDLQPRLDARVHRQELLNHQHVDYTAFLSTSALHNELCSPADFREQLRHLWRMSNRQGIELRLVESATAFAFTGWYLMDFENAGSVVLLEHLGSSTFLFDEEANPYLGVRRSLNDLALSARATQDRIGKLIDQYSTRS